MKNLVKRVIGFFAVLRMTELRVIIIYEILQHFYYKGY